MSERRIGGGAESTSEGSLGRIFRMFVLERWGGNNGVIITFSFCRVHLPFHSRTRTGLPNSCACNPT